ncbi:MAG: hypothetical protein K0S33_3750 [Bacteroidetes bacterium]|jgi:hypothetical protein|nr:hypothetical protein [Bacteroidota bacterium]
MKIITVLLALFALSTLSFEFAASTKSDPKNLIGTWDFVELLDSNNKHIDTLWDAQGFMVATGPEMTFKKDSTYSFKYTKVDSSNGTWIFDKRRNEIVLKLYWKKPYDEIAQYIMTLGQSKQDANGDYYDLIPEKIIELTSKKLVILEKENRQMIYKKIN